MNDNLIDLVAALTMTRINTKLGQENDARYLAYLTEYLLGLPLATVKPITARPIGESFTADRAPSTDWKASPSKTVAPGCYRRNPTDREQH